jgi:putative ABC transport system permease protein
MPAVRWITQLRLRVRSLLRGRVVEHELDEELHDHLQHLIEEYTRSGMTPANARYAALREMGAIETRKEECRDARRVALVETLVRDLRYGGRVLARNPGFAAIATLTLALGIGANTAIFSLVDGILLMPLPYRNPDQLVSVAGAYPTGAVVAMRDEFRSMDVAAYSEGHEFNLTGSGEPARLTGARVSAELFSILGVNPALGRVFDTGEDRAGNDRHVMLSHGLWEQRFQRDPSLVGRVIRLEGIDRQVVGIMPAAFRFGSSSAQLWVPFSADPKNIASYWAGDYMSVIGRLRPGSSLEQAGRESRAFQPRVRTMFPWRMPDTWNADVAVVPLHAATVGDVRGRLLLLLGAVGLVLLIACANVANLTLSRAATRQREIAIRGALGAGRGRIARQLITESTLLASIGGTLGVLFAIGGVELLTAALPAETPRLADVHIDARVLAFTSGLTIVTGVLFGLAPALQATRSIQVGSLRSGGRDGGTSISQWLRHSLVIGEVALAVLLVVGAGLLVRSFWRLSHANPGFQAEHVVTARISPAESFCVDTTRCLSFYERVLDRMQSAPGIAGAALVNTPPLGGRVTKRSFAVDGFTAAPEDGAPLLWLNAVTPQYFDVMRIPLVAGRWFADADRSGNPPVAIVSAATARRFWNEPDAVGKRVRFVESNEWHTIVGVVADVRAYDLQRTVPSWIAGTVYVPYSPRATGEDGRVPAAMTLVVRTASDQSSVDRTVRQLVASVNRDVAVSDVLTMDTMVQDAAATPASTAVLFVAFAGLAFVLGLIGIYGVLSFLVSKRTHEIGIRIALGAGRGHVLWLALRGGLGLSAIGIALGLGGAFFASRLLSSELYGVSSFDPATYVTVALGMLVATFIACWVPTRRALRVDPLEALREG